MARPFLGRELKHKIESFNIHSDITLDQMGEAFELGHAVNVQARRLRIINFCLLMPSVIGGRRTLYYRCNY